jgi:hypothetical protein
MIDLGRGRQKKQERKQILKDKQQQMSKSKMYIKQSVYHLKVMTIRRRKMEKRRPYLQNR